MATELADHLAPWAYEWSRWGHKDWHPILAGLSEAAEHGARPDVAEAIETALARLILDPHIGPELDDIDPEDPPEETP